MTSSKCRAVLLTLVVGLPAASCQKPDEASAAMLQSGKVRPEGLPKLQVTTAQVESAEVSRTLDLTGSLLADEQSNITAPTQGVVSETPVDVGSVVKKGEVLVRLDDRDARMRLAAAQASLVQARARLGLPLDADVESVVDGKITAQVNVDEVPEVRNARANQLSAKIDQERNKKLFTDGAISKSTMDLADLRVETMQNQVDMARNGVQQSLAGLAAAQVQVSMARKSLSDMTVRAPYSGAVMRRMVSVGEFTSPQAPVAMMVSTDKLRLALDVPESAVNHVALGHEVTLVVQGQPGEKFTGKISRIAPALDMQSRSLRAEATVDNAANKLRPGMFASARVILPARDVATFVPRGAVLTQAGVSKVFVLHGSKVEERIVVVGEPREDTVEVRGDLKAGDRVVTKDVDKLTDGAPVDG